MSELVLSQGGDTSTDYDVLGQALTQRESMVAYGIAALKDGTGRRIEHANLFNLEEPYVNDLARATYAQLSTASPEMSELELKISARKLLVGSVIRTKASALAQHHDSSPVEKARHYFELTKRSRILGGLVISASLFGAAGLAIKGIEMSPLDDISEDGVERLREIRGVAAITAGVMVAKPWHIATTAIARMSRYRAKNTVQTGLNKHDIAITSTLEERTAHITDSDERIRARYTILAEELGFNNVQSVISSGNVIFESDRTDVTAIEAELEEAWPQMLGFNSTTLIRSQKQIEQVIADHPYGNLQHGPSSYLLVTFFKHPTKVKFDLPYQPDGKTYKLLAATKDTLYTTTDNTVVKTTDLMTWLEKQYGKDISSRTLLTCQRILKKMQTS